MRMLVHFPSFSGRFAFSMLRWQFRLILFFFQNSEHACTCPFVSLTCIHMFRPPSWKVVSRGWSAASRRRESDRRPTRRRSDPIPSGARSAVRLSLRLCRACVGSQVLSWIPSVHQPGTSSPRVLHLRSDIG
jgi:hypothetical protein